MRLVRIAALATCLAFTTTAFAQATAKEKEDARARFERGLDFYKKKQLDAALAEFLASRDAYATRAAAFNIAKVYKELGRYDEALETLEATSARFGAELTPADKEELERELRDVKGHIGYVTVVASEPGATVVIDGRERTAKGDKTSVAVGTHVVRVHKDGFVPFESRVEVAAQATVKIDAKLGALTRGGRLSVSEDRGGALTVAIDGVAVGKTPWEGTVPVGAHSVSLRGEGRLGAPPTPVDIRLNQLTKISLVAEPLACTLRVEPTPRTAHVAIDGVEVGSGVWEGALRCGGHQVEIGAEGFVSRARTISLTEGPTAVAKDSLDRDPSSAVWQAKNPPKLTIEAVTTGFLSPSFGGDLGSSLGYGGSAVARVGYRLGIGLGASIDAGVLYARQTIEGRTTETRPYGLPPHPGTADDRLRLVGPMLGGSVSYAFGERFPFIARLGAGVLLGSLADARTGTFRTPNGTSYVLPEREQSPSMTAFYIDPEVRMGFRFARGWTFDVGVRALATLVLGDTPRWSDQTELSLGACPNADRQSCSGRGVYASSEVASRLAFFFGPSIGIRGEL